MFDRAKYERELKRWRSEYYGALVGFTVTEIDFEDDEFGGDPFPVLKLTNDDGVELSVEVSRDEEGNGAGFLHGLPMPEPIRR